MTLRLHHKDGKANHTYNANRIARFKAGGAMSLFKDQLAK